MTRNERLKMASILLSYPDESFSQTLDGLSQLCKETSDGLALAAVDALRTLPLPALARCYVAAFDMRQSTALYLTAHELGDSRERGEALLQIHALLKSAALEPREGELPDYLPLLLEFIAEKPAGMPVSDLEARMATVCLSIHERLEEGHPYRKVFGLIQGCLGNSRAGQRTAQKSPSKPANELDLDNLPYPLVYD